MVDLRQVANESRASQNKEELFWLLRRLHEINPKHILEIGVHQGYSLEVWEKAFNPEKMIGIDIDFSSYDKSLDKKVGAVLISGDSQDYTVFKSVQAFMVDLIDFLFIDGDHMYEAVKKDFKLYSILVRKGGVIVFHDAGLLNNPGVEVHKFWSEINTSYKSGFYKADDGTGVGILYKEREDE